MSPEAQRIAVAETCGWCDISTQCPWEKCAHPVGQLFGKLNGVSGYVPDYPNDLNAMHEAEKMLTGEQRIDYWNKVIAICDRDMGLPGKRWAATTFFIIHATAAQRCEAFLRTIGKWTD